MTYKSILIRTKYFGKTDIFENATYFSSSANGNFVHIIDCNNVEHYFASHDIIKVEVEREKNQKNDE